jgi:protein O-GlcNAc transferase
LFIGFTIFHLGNVRRNRIFDISDRSRDEKPVVASLARPPSAAISDAVALLPEYNATRSISLFCEERFGFKYLWNLARSRIDYCLSGSPSNLNCFRSKTAKEGRTDVFCIGGPASFEEWRFRLQCKTKERSSNDIADGIPSINQFPQYWYSTGPRVLFDRYISLDESAKGMETARAVPRRFTILVSREEKITNPWHALMEIFAMTMTLDVLRITLDPGTGAPFLLESDAEQTQVMILDIHPGGPFYELWNLFAKQPTIRSNEARAKDLEGTSIIVPLPGGANPFWQSDWEVLDCTYSPLLSAFSTRVLDFYRIEHEPIRDDKPLVLTLIDRREKRRLLEKERFIQLLQQNHPDIKVNLIDLAELPMSEQVRIASESDILAGVHGAGLTHAMFQRPDSALVEIIPHGFNHKGFRNLAKMRGLKYFGTHASSSSRAMKSGNWQEDDVDLEAERFLELMDVAIKSMYNRGTRNDDVS